MVKENKYSEQEVNKGFGIQVRPELVSIGARVLPPPMVIHHFAFLFFIFVFGNVSRS